MSLFNVQSDKKQDVAADQPLQGHDTKRLLQAQVQAQIGVLTDILDRFHAQPYKDTEDELKLAQDIIQAVDQILENIDTNESMFIKQICQPLEQYRRQAQRWYDQHSSELLAQSQPKQAAEHQMSIYVSLYQANAHRLEAWQQVLQNLSKQVVSRPVYTSEQAVIDTIRQTGAKASCYAYAVVLVDKAKVIPQDSADLQDCATVRLATKAFGTEHITELVHGAKRYAVINGELMPL